MLDSKTLVKNAMYSQGRTDALLLQERADDMTGTELHENDFKIPEFDPAKQYLDYKPGFTCKSLIGNVVRLLQPYDSIIYPAQPEELPAQWGFKWSTDPAHAKPFIALSTSPYMTGDCCIFDEKVYRSTIDNNVWSPADYPAGWEAV